jgi:hypothetical protein
MCAKMRQPKEKQSEFMESVLNEFPVLARPPIGPNKGFVISALVRDSIVRNGEQSKTRACDSQIEGTIANFNELVNVLKRAIDVELMAFSRQIARPLPPLFLRSKPAAAFAFGY